MRYRQRKYLIPAVSFAAIVAGACLIALWPSGNRYQPHSLPVREPSVTPSLPAAASSGATPPVFPRSVPTEIKIPAIDVDAKIVPVYDPCITPTNCPIDLTPLGQTQSLAGWWAGQQGSPKDSYSPGQAGPAIIVGHVNWAGVGPLVFANLYKLQQGDQIEVILQSGTTVTFTVDFLQDISKITFPTQSVYGPTPYPSLRLVTCTGKLLTSGPLAGHYDSSEIVYATESGAGK